MSLDIMEKDTLYICAKPLTSNLYYVDIETFISTFIYQLTDKIGVDLLVKLSEISTEGSFILCDLTNVKHTIISASDELTSYSKWPVVVSNKQVIAGLCSVSRFLIRHSDRIEVRKLLGFREACLLACSESSIWTRFCEVDIISVTKSIVLNKYVDGSKYLLPKEVARFEYHLSQPVRMHNIYKEARLRNRNNDIKSHEPVDKLNLVHEYSEGISMTLADAILYPCFVILFQNCPVLDLLQSKIPLITKWYKTMTQSFLPHPNIVIEQTNPLIDEVIVPEFIKQSLYTTDPLRYRPEKRIHTKQLSIEKAVGSLQPIENELRNNMLPFGVEVYFNWKEIPGEASPTGGALPAKRADRKCEQLQNIVKAVVKLASNKSYVIVDFCSGSGHVGILLAVLLPMCRILLVENKEQSLARASERIKALNLSNIIIVQSNLDYFTGKFDIGVALHACGVATDLVIETCVQNRAHFVVCPCCYGGVKNCHHLTYPRSKKFQELHLDYDGYLSLAHAADQTHDENNVKTKQGYYCMDVVDTDRRLYAESVGYEVHLGKLQPLTCTNKNNLLVGIFREKMCSVEK